MEFGLSLPVRGPLARPDLIARLAAKAEALGYSSLFVSDHVVLPARSRSVYPYHPAGEFPGGFRQDYLEPLALLGHLAGRTRRIRLGTSVLIVPYRNPVVTAKQLATLDVLSGGRLIVGCGAGWLEEEFRALAAPPFAERGRVTDEYLRLMKTLWTEDAPKFEGRYYQVSEVHFLPRPRQKPHPPLWIGGHTEPALRRAAELGDAWHPIGLRPPALLHPPEYARAVERLHGYARAAGRDPGAIALTFRAPLQLWGPREKSPGETGLLKGTAEAVTRDIRSYQAVGVRHFVFDLPGPDPKAMVETMERFAEEVRPRVARAPR